jgi:hypothetical protein
MWFIKDWKTIYETAESRKIKHLTWVAMPNKFDGRGFKRMMRHPDAPVALSCFLLMCQVASRVHKDHRDGRIGNSEAAYCACDLADITGMCEENFEKSFQLLSSQSIAWIEWRGNPRTTGRQPVTPGEFPDALGVIQTDRQTDRHTEVGPSQREKAAWDFDRLRTEYPAALSDFELQIAMGAMKTPTRQDQMFRILALYKKTPRWQDARYIPTGRRYFGEGMWCVEPKNSGESWVEELEGK